MIIYVITNLINGKQYVGQTVLTIEERWHNHCSKNSGCTALKNAITKYGKDNFKVEMLDTAESQFELDLRESYWIFTLNTLSPNGYNLKTGGDHVVFTDEVREKIRIANTGKILTNDRRKEISYNMKLQWELGKRQGHPISDKSRYVLKDWVKKNGAWNKGLPKEQQPLYGKPKPLEVREKISKKLSKPIVCVELNKVYENAQIASKELGIQYSNISRCLHGRSHTAGGYHWRWYNAQLSEIL